MKILIISHEFPPIGGGGANACMYLSKHYAEVGNEVTLITSAYQNLEKIEYIYGVKIIRVNSKRKYKDHCGFGEMLSFLMKALPRAEKEEKICKFDICHVFFGIPSGPIGYYLKKKYHLPYVIRFGGGDIPGFQERFVLIYKLLSPFVKIIWNNADALVANSEGLKLFAQNFYRKKAISVICNGVDDKVFIPKYKKKEMNEIIILFVSRLIERKGLQFIIPELKEIQEAVNVPIRLMIVGEGPYRQELEDIALENKVSQLISFEGHKDKNEILEYYQKGDLFILPSNREGMPNVVLEAMACGLPIIMTPCEGSKELISDNGYIDNIQNIKNRIIELCNDSLLRKKMGNRSRIIIEEKFGWSNVGERYINLFQNIIE